MTRFLFTLLLLLVSVSVLAPQAFAEKTSVDSSDRLGLSDAERAWLAAHPVLRLGIDRKFAPYEWIDQNGQYTGIAAEYMALLEQRLGVRIEPARNKSSWGAVLEAARNGEFDMISCLVKTDEREAYLKFSKPYLSSVAVIISEQSSGYIGQLDRLAGKTVAIHKGHYTNERLKADYPDIRIINTATIEAALQLVAEGKAVAFVGDVTAASYAMKQQGLLNLSFSGQTDYVSEYRIGVSQANPLLSSIVDKALASITQAERDAIYERWNGLEIPGGIQPETVFKYGAAVLLLMLLFTYWNYRLRVSEQAHRLSQQRFKNLIETTDGIVWEADAETFQFSYISENAERLLGYSVADWLQPGFWAAHIHPEDRDWAVQYCAEQTCLLTDHDFEYRFLTADGKEVWLRDMVSVVLQEGKPRWLRGLMLDITEVKQAGLLVKQSEQRFRELIESLPAIAVQGYDAERHVIYWNAASSELYGYDREEALGRKLEELLVPEENRAHVIAEHAGWLQQGQEIAAGEMELVHKSGKRLPVFSSHVMLKTASGDSELFCLDISLAEQKRVHQELTHIASFDPLTQLPNRRTFLDRLDQQVKNTNRNGSQLAVMLLDLDHFKEVNDTLGHDRGDMLLQEAARRLQQCVRETDTVARLGGDEFTIIVGDFTELRVIERIAQNILQAMVRPFYLLGDKAYVSTSIGITLYPDDAGSIEALLKNADQAMYAAKARGRNCFNYFTVAMEQAAQQRRMLVNDLRTALAEQQFQLFYQPIVDLNTYQVHKAEALIRWQHPQLGLVAPLDFIAVAEDTGMIIDIGNWVFKEAVEQVAAWKSELGVELQVSVNTSPVQFKSEGCNQQQWFDQLAAVGLSGSTVVVEITEGLLMEASRAVKDKLLAFRDAGVEVSLDDFGTGYSSLSYLKRFDIDYLKIDKAFVSNLAVDSNDLALCEAIIVMAHKLGIMVIAEGVETEQQRDLLISAGCDYGQGYLFSRPVPADQFAKLLAQESRLEMS